MRDVEKSTGNLKKNERCREGRRKVEKRGEGKKMNDQKTELKTWYISGLQKRSIYLNS